MKPGEKERESESESELSEKGRKRDRNRKIRQQNENRAIYVPLWTDTNVLNAYAQPKIKRDKLDEDFLAVVG